MVAQYLRRFLQSLFARRPVRRAPTRPFLEVLDDRTMPSTVYGLTAGNILLRFDSATPGTIQSTVTISGLQSGSERVIGIDFRPRTGQLIGTTVPVGVTSSATLQTYSINPLTGAATFIGTISSGTVSGAGDADTGYDFNPSVDRIRVVNENNANFRINPNNGSLAGGDTDLTYTAPATGPVVGLAYDRNFDRTATSGLPTTLYGIDTGSSRLVVQGGLNGAGPGGPNGGAITSVGPLGVTVDAGTDTGFDIAVSTANGGLGTALAALTVSGTTGLYSIDLSSGTASPLGNIGNGATPLTGLAIVPDGVVVVGSGAGANGDVRLLDPTTGAVRVGIVPFAGFRGGMRVAAGDINRDGIPDAVVSAVAPQGHVKVFDGLTGGQLPGAVGSFFAFAGFQGTVNIAAGDVNADGFDDVLVVANGANGHVKAFSGADGSLLGSFFAFSGFMGNCTIASADFNNDGTAEIVVTAAVNGHVKVFNADGTLFTSTGFVNSFLAFNGYSGDVFTAAGDLDGDGRADIVVASGPGSLGHVKAFSGANGSPIASFLATAVTFGVAPPTQVTTIGGLGVADVNGDGRYDIVVTPNAGKQANVFAFDLNGTLLLNYAAFANFQGGATVGGVRF